jgi:hypothetical protein
MPKPRLIVSLTPELQTVIEAMAREANLSLSSTARWMLLQQAKTSTFAHLLDRQQPSSGYNGSSIY